jgi:uncharacterized spore protein YtfJ
METPNFLEKLSSQFGTSATVKNVFGEPVQAGGKTIIPVAQIAYGLGGGYGQGNKRGMPVLQGTTDEEQNNDKGEGAGGGGGMVARPKGVYEITPEGTRFIPVTDAKQILLGVAAGFVLSAFLRARRRRLRAK